jgi:hypothetical protein
MKLWGWGGIVPWIGYRESEVSYEDAEMAFGITQSARGSEPGYWRIEVLDVEWFGFGMTLAVRPIIPEPPL